MEYLILCSFTEKFFYGGRTMKSKSRVWLTTLLLGLCAILGVGVFFATDIAASQTAHAARSSTAWVTVGEIYDDASGTFRVDQINKLYKYLTGENTFESVQAAAAENKTSNDFRTLNGEKNITVTFGGIKWDAVYLTTAKGGDGDTKAGDVILDLWRSSDTLTSTDKAQFASWANNPSKDPDKYPSAMYSTSTIRVVTLNAGGKYSTAGDALSELQQQSAENQYARFTMNGVENSLTKYIAKPVDVGYQAKEYSDNVSRDNSNKANNGFYHPNSSYEYVSNKELPGTSPQWNGSNANKDGLDYRMCFGSEAKDALREDGAKYGSWKDDYLWLPSAEETGRESSTARTGIGIWYTDASLRSSTTDAWTRSGRTNDAAMAVSLMNSGDYNQNRTVTSSYYVRPALHLNLTAASQVIALSKAAWQNQSKPYVSGGVKWEVNTDGVTIEAVGDDTSWWNADTHTITAHKFGEYKLKVTPTDGYQWSDETSDPIEVTYTVTKAEVTLQWENKTFTYKGEAYEYPTATAKNISNDGVTVTVTMEGNTRDFKDAGTYTFTATLGGDKAENYTIKAETATKEYTIAKAAVTAPESFASAPYTGAEQTVVIDGEAQYKLAEGSGKGTDVGSYDVTLELKDPANYKWADIDDPATESAPRTFEKAFEITAGSVTLTWSDTAYTYNGAEQAFPTASVNGVEGLTVKVELDGDATEFKNAGTYTFKATLEGDGAGNYTIAEATHTYTIAKAAVTAPTAFDSAVYNGAEQTVAIDGEAQYKLAESSGKGTDAGKYDVTLELKDPANYKWDEEGDNSEAKTLTQAFEITPAEVEIVWAEKSYTYDGTNHAEDLPTATATGLGEDKLEVTVALDGEKEFVGAGTYTFTATLGGDKKDNYTIKAGSGTHTYTIAKAKSETKVVWSGSVFTYTGEVQSFPTAKLGEDGAELTVTLTRAPEGFTEFKNVGFYMFTATDANYDLQNSAVMLVEISPAAVKLVWSEGDYTYNGAEQTAPTATATGLKDEVFTVTVTLDGEDKFVGAGTYTFTATLGGDAAVLANYTISASDKTHEYTIAKAVADVVWTVGEYTYNGSVQTAPKATISGLGDDGEIALEVATDGEFKNVGTYTFTATLGEAAAANYELGGNTTVEASIAKAEVEVVWSAGEYTYTGDVLATPTAKVNGLGDDCEITLNVSGEGEFKNVGTYTFTAALGEDAAANYTLKAETTTQSYSVAKAVVTAPTLGGKVYNGEKQTATVAESDRYSVKENNGGISVGEYGVVLTLTDSANYAWQGSDSEDINLTFAITKATYNMSGVKFEGATYKEDGTAKSLAVTGDLPADVVVTYENNNQVKYGVYEVVAKFSGDFYNYNEIADMKATMTILRTEMQTTAKGDEDKPQGNLNVTVESDEGLDPEIELVVEYKDAPSESSDKVLKDSGSLAGSEKVGAVFDITLKSEGVEVQPSGTIKIKMRIPDSMKDKEFRLLHIHGDEAEEVEYEIKGDYVVFTTDSLSEFVLTYKTSTWWIWLIVGIAAVLVIALVIVLVRKARKKKA